MLILFQCSIELAKFAVSTGEVKIEQKQFQFLILWEFALAWKLIDSINKIMLSFEEFALFKIALSTESGQTPALIWRNVWEMEIL